MLAACQYRHGASQLTPQPACGFHAILSFGRPHTANHTRPTRLMSAATKVPSRFADRFNHTTTSSTAHINWDGSCEFSYQHQHRVMGQHVSRRPSRGRLPAHNVIKCMQPNVTRPTRIILRPAAHWGHLRQVISKRCTMRGVPKSIKRQHKLERRKPWTLPLGGRPPPEPPSPVVMHL